MGLGVGLQQARHVRQVIGACEARVNLRDSDFQRSILTVTLPSTDQATENPSIYLSFRIHISNVDVGLPFGPDSGNLLMYFQCF